MPLVERRKPEKQELTDFEKFIEGVISVLPTAADRRTFYIKFGALALFMVIVFIAIGAAAMGVGRGDPAPAHVLSGSVVIANTADFTVDGTTCAGTGNFALLKSGSVVNIAMPGRSPSSATLGIGSMTSEGTCSLPFSATLPEVDSYSFSIGSLAPVTKTQTDIASADGLWTATVTWD